MAAARSVACLAVLDHIAGTVTTKSIGMDCTTLGDSFFSSMLMKWSCRQER